MEILAVAVAVTVGALVKSVTGIGLPPIAIPVLAIMVGPRDAVIIMTLSTIVTNAYLAWQYRDAVGQTKHLGKMTAAGIVGTPVGVYFLTSLDSTVVGLVLGITVVGYIALALFKPDLALSPETARRSALPVGLAGGALQGATGLSSVILASYIHALGIPPRAFVFTVSILFQVFAIAQAIGFAAAGVYTQDLIVASIVAAAAGTFIIALGTRFIPPVSPVVFHRLVLAVLGLSSIKLFYDVLA